MPKLKNLLSVAAFGLLAMPVYAQGVGSLSDGSLAMGEEVAAPAAQPPVQDSENVGSEMIGDWDLQCALDGPEPRPCRLYQLMMDDQGSAIAEVTLFKLDNPSSDAVAGATFVVPLETLLPAQMTVSVDGSNARRYPFAFCNPVGCFSRIGLTQEDIDAFKAGDGAKIAIVPAIAPDQVVTVDMSLKGFTAAFDQANAVPE